MEGVLDCFAELDAFVKTLSVQDRSATVFPFSIEAYKKELMTTCKTKTEVQQVVREAISEAKSAIKSAARKRKLEEDFDTALNKFDGFIMQMTQEERVLVDMQSYNVNAFDKSIKAMFGGDTFRQLEHLNAHVRDMKRILDVHKRAAEHKAKGISIVKLLWRYNKLHDIWSIFVRGRLSANYGGPRFDTNERFIAFCGQPNDWTNEAKWLGFLDDFSSVLEEIEAETKN